MLLLTKLRTLVPMSLPYPPALVWPGVVHGPEVSWMTPKLLYGRLSQQSKSKQSHFSISHSYSILMPAGEPQGPRAPFTLCRLMYRPLRLWLCCQGPTPNLMEVPFSNYFFLFFEVIAIIFLFPLPFGGSLLAFQKASGVHLCSLSLPLPHFNVFVKICLIRFSCGYYLRIPP